MNSKDAQWVKCKWCESCTCLDLKLFTRPILTQVSWIKLISSLFAVLVYHHRGNTSPGTEKMLASSYSFGTFSAFLKFPSSNLISVVAKIFREKSKLFNEGRVRGNWKLNCGELFLRWRHRKYLCVNCGRVHVSFSLQRKFFWLALTLTLSFSAIFGMKKFRGIKLTFKVWKLFKHFC